jgi:putative hydrolase of HD superfamily
MSQLSVINERISGLIAFLLEIEKLQQVKRIIHYKDGSQENSAEHSWHVAMFCLLLTPEVDPTADVTRVIKMALIHDLVEIYAGDTFLFDDEARKSKEKRERDAAKKLFAQLPQDREKEFWALFEEFEGLATPEAKIVKSFDHLQPLVHNLIHDGATWQRHHLTADMHDAKKRPNMTHNKIILKIYEDLHKNAVSRKLFAND